MEAQKERLKEFEKKFENWFEYVGDACFVRQRTEFKAYTHCGTKSEGEAYDTLPETPEQAVTDYIEYINSLNISNENILLWRDRPILDCFDDEGKQVCTVYSRFAMLKGVQ